MTFLVDTNILLDLALNRQPWADDAKRFFDGAAALGVTIYVSAVTLPTLFYITEKQADTAAAFAAIDRTLAAAEIVEVSKQTLLAARSMSGMDFEDNVQIACAVAVSVERVVTRDPNGFAGSPVPALTAADAMQLIGLKPLK